MRARFLSITGLILLVAAGLAAGQSRNEGSMPLTIKSTRMPFSFVYDGKKSDDLLPRWRSKTLTTQLDKNRTQLISTYTDSSTGLQVRCVSIRYCNFPAVEWTVYVKNNGKQTTPVVENLQAIDWSFDNPSNQEFLLHHNVGSPGDGSDYSPLETPLPPGATKHISGAGGRPTNSDLSYFNLEFGKQGTIVVVGWPGQWAADFNRSGSRRITIRAGQELTHFRLHPGEEVRSPLIVVLNWRGDWIQGQNSWRRWMMGYGMPKPNGQLPKPMFLASSGRAYGEMIGANEANQIMHIDRYLEEGINLDYWWMDAGWYVQQQGWPQVGTWEVDRKRFPNGFKPISEHAHKLGVKTLVWFEPERVAPHTWLADNHPEWLLNPLGSLVQLKSSKLGSDEPCVVFNSSDHQLSWAGIHWGPRSLSFHPGPKGEYSAIRYVAPMSGEHKVKSTFTGIDEQTTTDVHILLNGKSIFDSAIRLNSKGRIARHEKTLDLKSGDILDFVVGYGNGDYRFDSTGVEIVVTDPEGKSLDAAKEFASWQYGFLKPGANPDSSTFEPYDLRDHGGTKGNQLLDLGNPNARKWLIEHVDKIIVDNGIDLYRQDFNMDPLLFGAPKMLATVKESLRTNILLAIWHIGTSYGSVIRTC